MNKCPVCGKKTVKETAPFCSRHCANIDLIKWLQSEYSVPAVEDDEIPENFDGQDPTQH